MRGKGIVTHNIILQADARAGEGTVKSPVGNAITRNCAVEGVEKQQTSFIGVEGTFIPFGIL